MLNKHFSLQRHMNRALTYRGIWRDQHNLRLGLRGEHQLDNGALALAAVEVLGRNGFAIDDEAVRKGLKTVTWPGRLEVMRSRSRVILDGAHNPDAMKYLARAMQHDFDYERLILVLGIMSDKDIPGMLREIVPLAHSVLLCRPRLDRAASTATLAGLLRGFGVRCKEMKSVKEAMVQALSEARRHDLVCVTGSLFTVGEARKAFARINRATISPRGGFSKE